MEGVMYMGVLSAILSFFSWKVIVIVLVVLIVLIFLMTALFLWWAFFLFFLFFSLTFWWAPECLMDQQHRISSFRAFICPFWLILTFDLMRGSLTLLINSWTVFLLFFFFCCLFSPFSTFHFTNVTPLLVNVLLTSTPYRVPYFLGFIFCNPSHLWLHTWKSE